MNEFLTLGLGAAAIVLVLIVWLRGWLFRCSAAGIIVIGFSAGYLQLMGPVRVVELLLVSAMIAYLLQSKQLSIGSSEKMMLLGVSVVSCAAFGISQVFITDSEADPLFRYTLLYPAIFIAGYLAVKAGKGLVVARLYVYVGLGMALLAAFERLRGTFLVADTYEYAERLVRDGHLRSVVFSEHPLVLAALLAAATPFVPLTFKSKTISCIAYGMIVGGVLSTNSRGALIIIAVWFLVRAASKVNFPTIVAARLAKFAGLLGGAWAFVMIILGDGTDELSSTSALDASAEYRGALYTFAVRSLIEQPFGWGISGLPEGVYLLPSYFGVLDISKTVDSELALAMFDFGWLGIFGFSALLILQLRVKSITNPFGQAALVITASGFYLALHSWVGLGSMWLLLGGLALASSTTITVDDMGKAAHSADPTIKSNLQDRHHRPYNEVHPLREN